MMLIGVDLHTRDQSIATVDTETGEMRELRLRHDSDAVEQFYRGLTPPVTVGIESTGYAFWFHQLMHRLGHTLVVGMPPRFARRSCAEPRRIDATPAKC